jgi:hypothetical protein
MSEARLALSTALLALVLGGTTLWFGLAEGAIACWGFGAACLLQVGPALSLHQRIREGLGNRGLERERLTLRMVSHLLRLLALGVALTAAAALMAERTPLAASIILGWAALSVATLAALWWIKRRPADRHPALTLDAARTRTLLELAALLLAGQLLGRWFPWSDAVAGLVMALRLFLEGRTLAKGTTLPVVCGGCGSGCGGS